VTVSAKSVPAEASNAEEIVISLNLWGDAGQARVGWSDEIMSRMIEVQAPAPFDSHPRPWIFLAGSIEGDTAERWQSRVVGALAHPPGTILNPRRDDWHDWKEEIGNPDFRVQVEWELRAQEAADLILMYFAPGTRSPITLLELGLFARTGKLVVCCPPGFWKKGNVDVVCGMLQIPRVENLDQLIARALT
jgi:hypothetical protein